MKRVSRLFARELARPPPVQLPRSFDDAAQRSVWLRGVPPDWTEVHLLKYFDRFARRIEQVRPVRDALDRPTDRALLRFNDARTAEEFVHRYHNDFINSPTAKQRLHCSLFALQRSATRMQARNAPTEVELYNLPFEASNLDVLRLVGQPAPTRLQMPMRSAERNKGFAVLSFACAADATGFVARVAGLTLLGRPLHARQGQLSFVTHKPRFESRSDAVFARAELREVRAEAGLLRAMLAAWPRGFDALNEA